MVDCAPFDAPMGFPVEVLRSTMRLVVMKMRYTEARCDFEDILPGTYAFVALHGESMIGKLDANRVGIPKESCGSSNSAGASLGAPSFSAARLACDGKDLDPTPCLRYQTWVAGSSSAGVIRGPCEPTRRGDGAPRRIGALRWQETRPSRQTEVWSGRRGPRLRFPSEAHERVRHSAWTRSCGMGAAMRAAGMRAALARARCGQREAASPRTRRSAIAAAAYPAAYVPYRTERVSPPR